MGIKKLFGGKRYFNVIYLWISMLVAVLLLVFSVTVYSRSRKTILDSIYTMNRQVFAEIQIGIEQTDENVRNICMSLYVNPVVSRMMLTKPDQDNIYDWITDFQKLYGAIMNSNSAIHSIYIYNPDMDMYFSSYRHLFYQDEFMDSFFEKDTLPMILTPISRTITVPGESKETRVITYVLYEDVTAGGKPNGAVIVNIKTTWMEESISKLGQLEKDEQSNILVFDGAGNWVVDTFRLPGVSTKASMQFCVQQMKKNQQDGFFMETSRLDNEKYAVFHSRTGNWNIVKVQPYEAVFKYVNDIRTTILIITPIFCLLFIFAAFYLTRRIYKPIGNLVTKVKLAQVSEQESFSNEMVLLSQAYDKLIDRAGSLEKFGNETDFIVASYHLKNLLLDSNHTDVAALQKKSTALSQLLNLPGEYVVCILSMDNMHKFSINHTKKDHELHQYAMMNIVLELVSRYYKGVSVTFDLGTEALLLKVSSDELEEYTALLAASFSEANSTLQQHFNISFTASISATETHISDITRIYRMAQNNMVYRYITGNPASITPKLVEQNNQYTQHELPEASLKAVVTHLENGDKQNLNQGLKNIQAAICKQNYQYLVPTLMSFVLFAINTAIKVDADILERENLPFSELYKSYTRMETCDEVFDNLGRLLLSAMSKQSVSDPKNVRMVDTAVNLIEKGYADESLCLQELANKFGLSSQYLGRTFKDAVGLSVADYISDIRMLHAAEFLLTGKHSVRQVASLVAIENEQQFYRLFKKKYGETPKQFVRQNHLQDGKNKKIIQLEDIIKKQ